MKVQKELTSTLLRQQAMKSNRFRTFAIIVYTNYQKIIVDSSY